MLFLFILQCNVFILFYLIGITTVDSPAALHVLLFVNTQKKSKGEIGIVNPCAAKYCQKENFSFKVSSREWLYRYAVTHILHLFEISACSLLDHGGQGADL